MDKVVELLKKLKALAEKGMEGEAANAKMMLDKLLAKHGLSLHDIEGAQTKEYFFKTSGINARLLAQIVKRVNFELNLYAIPAHTVRLHRYPGNYFVECTAAEFVEIEQMFAVYTKLYEKENRVFYTAFITANDLLAIPPADRAKTTADLTPEEFKEWERTQVMAKSIKTETIRKQLNEAPDSNPPKSKEAE